MVGGVLFVEVRDNEFLTNLVERIIISVSNDTKGAKVWLRMRMQELKLSLK